MLCIYRCAIYNELGTTLGLDVTEIGPDVGRNAEMRSPAPPAVLSRHQLLHMKNAKTGSMLRLSPKTSRSSELVSENTLKNIYNSMYVHFSRINPKYQSNITHYVSTVLM